MIIDHKTLAISRLATQFRESTNLISYIRTLLLETNTLEGVFHSLLNERWINTAIGVQLDILGSIVGQPREIIDAELFGYFGFAVNLESGSFGSLDNPSEGERFRANKEPVFGKRLLSDSEYRLWIRARIITNKTSSTPEDIIVQIKFFIEAEQVLFVDGDTEYTVSISKILTAEEKSTLLNSDIVPKTVGVKVNYLTQYEFSSFFGFQGVPSSLGLGSVNYPDLGGKLGKLII
tara:strand:- start:741 stop:1442 length:702 start_codon:yes stop_codon:yes gene_type:complete